jgi:hypothetical protein
MVTEGNCFVVYMYENIVESSLNLRSEQRFYFMSPYHENPVYFINYYNRQSSCRSGLAGASGGEAGWPDECWQLLVESAVVLLLVDSLLQYSLDASVVVTDASVPEDHIFILLSLGGALTKGHWRCHGER